MLDDFGSENMTPWLRDEVLGPIINYRSLEKKPICISSNLEPHDLQNHLICSNSSEDIVKEQRIWSRIERLVVYINMNDSEKILRLRL